MEYWLRRSKRRLADDSEADAYATYSTNLLNKTMVCDTANAVRATGTEGYYSHYMTRLSLGDVANRREKIRTCEVPVLVMKAQCDNQPWGYTQEYLDLFRNSKMRMIRNAGHNIFIEQPEEYLKTLAEFIE